MENSDHLREIAERLRHLMQTMGWSLEEAAAYLMIRLEVARKAMEDTHAE
jgi:hypothetical protein